MESPPTRPPFSISRYTITSAEQGDPARTLRELNALWALGAILNKRNWITKWTTQPHVRAKWLVEIEDALVKSNVAHMWREWPDRLTLRVGFDGTDRLLSAANMTNEQEKHQEIARIREHVMYPAGQYDGDAFHEGTYYGSNADDGVVLEQDDEDDDDSENEQAQDEHAMKQTGGMANSDSSGEDEEDEDESEYGEEEEESDYEDDYGFAFYKATAIDHKFPMVFRDHQKKNPFGQIAWYVAMSIVRESLCDLDMAHWTAPRISERTRWIWAAGNQTVILRASELISNVLRDDTPVTMQLVRNHLPLETRKNVLKLLQLHLAKIRVHVKTTTPDITTVLDLVVKNVGLCDFVKSVELRGQPPKTWLSDDCIPAELKTKFVSEIALLENVPDHKKDWHPNSNDQVLNLVHPSLYCAVAYSTQMIAASDANNLYASPAAHMRAIIFAPTPAWPVVRNNYGNNFQWLPCEVDVAERDGTARVRTYINNLHPEDHTGLYDSIGTIFTRFVPLFDQVLSSLDTALQYDTTAMMERMLAREIGMEPRASLCRMTPPALFEYNAPRFTLKGKRCQVIVKIAEIVLTPEKPTYDGGSWHVEGTDTERIMATGLYYFGCENITESRLSFRTLVQAPMYEQSDEIGMALAYGLKNYETLMQPLGSVTAMEDRCVVFPNILQHKVEPFRLEDPSKPGVRKILAFFLVDPTRDPIPSTAVVPPQQQEWVDRAQDMASERMSLEQAQAFRLELMKERSPMENQFSGDVMFSLCEH